MRSLLIIVLMAVIVFIAAGTYLVHANDETTEDYPVIYLPQKKTLAPNLWEYYATGAMAEQAGPLVHLYGYVDLLDEDGDWYNQYSTVSTASSTITMTWWGVKGELFRIRFEKYSFITKKWYKTVTYTGVPNG